MKKSNLKCWLLATQDVIEAQDVDMANLNTQVAELRRRVVELERKLAETAPTTVSWTVSSSSLST